MTIKTDTIQPPYQRPGKNLLAAVLTVLLISGCASTPKDLKEEKIDPAQAKASVMFEQAREAYRDFDYSKTIALLNTTAALGDANSQYALGYMYYYGYGVIRDENIALEWFEKAAARGHAKAITALDRVKIIKTYEQDKTSLDIQPAARPATEPDHHAQLMMQAETTEPDLTVLPTTEDIAPSAATTSIQTDPEVPAENVATQAEQISDNSGSEKMATAIDPATAPAAEATPGQAWLQNQNPDHYTIQVISSGNLKRVRQYMEKYGLTRQSAYFSIQRANQAVIYIGVYGVYSSVAEARQILQSLPEPVKDVQPWIRDFKSIQAELH